MPPYLLKLLNQKSWEHQNWYAGWCLEKLVLSRRRRQGHIFRKMTSFLR